MNTYSGGCYCGNISVELQSEKTPAELGVRTDTCTFCKKHASLYTADPRGSLTLHFKDSEKILKYRFGTKTADFLICTLCGVFVAAYMEENSFTGAVVNIHTLDRRDDFLQLPVSIVDLDDETLADRLARRKKRWTPAKMTN